MRRDKRIIDLLGEDVAENAFRAFSVYHTEIELLKWLRILKIDDEIDLQCAQTIARCWGDRAIPALRKNPYLLLSFLPWQRVDRVAAKLGIGRAEQLRSIAAVEAALYGQLEQGHTASSAADVIVAANTLLGGQANVSEETLRRSVKQGGAALLDGMLQPTGAAFMEEAIAQWVSVAINEGYEGTGHNSAEQIVRYFHAAGASLTETQLQAVVKALTHRFSLIAGYVGTGKTTCLKAVCDIAKGEGRKIQLMAVSESAVYRMSEATGGPASTISAFLQKAKPGAGCLARDDLCIIDEASSVDLPTLWQVVRRLGEASLVLIGDPAQPPPTGFGLTFQAFLQEPRIPSTRLAHLARHCEATEIACVAEGVRSGRPPALSAWNNEARAVSFNSCSQSDALPMIMGVLSHLAERGFSRDDVQIISPIRSGNAGIDAINAFFHSQRRIERQTSLFLGRCEVGEDDPIVWEGNDWDRGLLTGALGRVERVRGNRAWVRFGESLHTLTVNDRHLVAPAYALSVQKAQGSKWPAVIIPVFTSPLLDRTLLYSAITRASQRVVLIGDIETFYGTIRKKPKLAARRSGLYLRTRMNIENAQH